MKRQIKALALFLLRNNVSNKLKEMSGEEPGSPGAGASNATDVPGYPGSCL